MSEGTGFQSDKIEAQGGRRAKSTSTTQQRRDWRSGSLFRPWLWLSAETSHSLFPYALKLLKTITSKKSLVWSSLEWRGLFFKNPLGIAGGVDKNAQSIREWSHLGAGFVEVGTVTPKPQTPNPGKIIGRHTQQQALWNKMGFPNGGVEAAVQTFQKNNFSSPVPIFINVGKNRTTHNELAAQDYIYCMNELHQWADAFVINISSPNTKGLRELLQPEYLESFLKPILDCGQKLKTPTLLKLSPDIDSSQLKTILTTSLRLGIDGWILTNTTIQRSENSVFPTEGGVSGSPLSKLSAALLRETLKILGDDRKGKLVVSCGGIMTPEDVFERLRMGADLVQVYSALVFSGPYFFNQVAQQARSE